MSTNSKIEWTEHTANLWHGCTKVHRGCEHCYAETLTRRWGRDIWGPDKPRLEVKSVWKDLKNQQAAAAAAGTMARVFVGSMMDIFEKSMPLIDSNGVEEVLYENTPSGTESLRIKLFKAIHAGNYPNLIFLFLTKRPSNINKMIPTEWLTDPPPNVMFGTSPCNQATANTLIPQLLKVKGPKFLSCEPLTGEIDLNKIAMFRYVGIEKFVAGEAEEENHSHIDWIIAGGESGNEAQPMHPLWVRTLQTQCERNKVPFFFKQWGEWAPQRKKMNSKRTTVVHEGVECDMFRVGKQEAGRELDGNTYSEFPWDLFKSAIPDIPTF